MAHHFYGRPIFRNKEEKMIESILEKYKKEPANEELKQKIWDELQLAKHEGKITIPFKLELKKDPTNKFPDLIEVILDSKV